jgi:hypothetical protein
MLRHPRQRHRRLCPQPPRQLYFLRVSFAPTAQIILRPSKGSYQSFAHFSLFI